MNKFKVGDRVASGKYKGVITRYFNHNFFEVNWFSIGFKTYVGGRDVKPIIKIKNGVVYNTPSTL